MDERDLALRDLTYNLFVGQGRAPTADELRRAAGVTTSAVHAGWHGRHDAHALMLNPRTMEIRMANPFSAIPSAHRVNAAGRWWYANCAWDAFGICGALHVDGRIETSCPDCGDPIAVKCTTSDPTTRSPSSAASSRPPIGGTKSSSLEPR